MAIHSDHKRKGKGLTREDLPNVRCITRQLSLYHSRAAEGCAESQWLLPGPALTSIQSPYRAGFPLMEVHHCLRAPRGSHSTGSFMFRRIGVFLAFEKLKHRAQVLQHGAVNCRALTFNVHFSFHRFACCVPRAVIIWFGPSIQHVSKWSVCLSVLLDQGQK